MIIVELAFLKRTTVKEKVLKNESKKKLRKTFPSTERFFKNVRIIFISLKYFTQNSTRIVERDYAFCVESLLHLGQESYFMWSYS